jgi:hypothetical protein
MQFFLSLSLNFYEPFSLCTQHKYINYHFSAKSFILISFFCCYQSTNWFMNLKSAHNWMETAPFWPISNTFCCPDRIYICIKCIVNICGQFEKCMFFFAEIEETYDRDKTNASPLVLCIRSTEDRVWN